MRKINECSFREDSVHNSIEDRYQRHRSEAEFAEKDGRWEAAVREWREAIRIRPNCIEASNGLKRAVENSEKKVEEKQPVDLSRFARQFNLSIRYWDDGQPGWALKEARAAMQTLRDVLGNKFPGPGCAAHNVLSILKVSKAARLKKNSACSTYSHALWLFDQRQLGASEKQLVSLHTGLRLKRGKEDLRLGLEEDISSVRSLKKIYTDCHGPLLPCLLSRFAKDGDGVLENCRDWWESLRDMQGVKW